MLSKLRSAVDHAHSEEYEGVKQDKGLRMLVFGKPGSGKVRHEIGSTMASCTGFTHLVSARVVLTNLKGTLSAR